MSTATAEQVMEAFEAFKKHYDAQLAETRKGMPSAETVAAVERSNAAITELQEQISAAEQVATEQKALIESLENRLNRPKVGGNRSGDFTDEQIESYAAFESRVRNGGRKEVDPSDVDLDFIGTYRQAFYDVARRGNYAKRESVEILNEMSVDSQPNGGYWVDPDTSGRIVEFVRETSPVRDLATVTTIDGDALEGEYDVDEAGTGGFVGERENRPGNTGTPEIWRWRIPLHEQYAEPRTTQRFLDFTRRGGVEDWLVRKVGQRFARVENNRFVVGEGVDQPRGFLTYPAGTPATTTPAAYRVIRQVNSGSGSGLTDDGLVDLVYSIKSAYRAGSVFGMTRLTEAAVRKLKDDEDRYIWQPDFTRLGQSTLLGFPIVEMADLPEIQASALPIAFGNFRDAYQIGDSGGIRLIRDDITLKGWVKFYMTRYVAGDVVNFDALSLQTIASN